MNGSEWEVERCPVWEYLGSGTRQGWRTGLAHTCTGEKRPRDDTVGVGAWGLRK